ncbi:hypothetical protein DOS74_03155 [Staphylococcus felis]|uniref:Uncharacterized protein n=1 Tax=Staphylococcus felis TaxID=46127 RepID=A0A3E0ILJ3_9STAP|nr:hypothetical protein [Staphylococcus felis]REH82327.1 hypothetical protein DOS61_09735 [Staphylococcus felis]REH90221.1 hypothetical protein DOS83_12705 [Staphylococcus felis]REH92860.1 hypothetical protein DOS58_00390 [Staphylococcus felis]REI17870.1 hypothetical protein DOS74_03155 [Staphylococcus felis]REI18774.1 hypothetical protein DOS75_02810 [Staphylococcus felis]
MKKRTKTRKKLTEQEAKDRIQHIATQIANETEFYLILAQNTGKTVLEVDNTLRFCLLVDGYLNIDDAIEDLKERVGNMSWKIQEDLSRFLPDGYYQFIGGLTLNINREKVVSKQVEQMELF